MKPMIGIIGKAETKYDEDLWNRITLWDEFRYMIVKNGGIALMLLPSQETLTFNDDDIRDDTVLTEEQKEDMLDQTLICDGFILQGGLASSSYEIEFAKMAIEQDKPLLGICAGFNNILRALGSDVVLDKTGNHNHYDISYRHPVKIEKGTMLYELIGSKEYSVNSIHTMVAQKDMVSPFADINAYSEDGLVEGFEMDDMNFVLGLKWHPELMREEKFTQRLFEVFMDQCREF